MYLLRIGKGAKACNVEILETPANAKWQVKDVFTTIHGHWYFENHEEYGIPTWAIDDYHQPGELGGSNHLNVRIQDKNGKAILDHDVTWQNSGANRTSRPPNPKTGWADIPIFNNFKPEFGENGGWEHGTLHDYYYVKLGGLPNNNHMSTFVVLEPKTGIVTPPPPPPPPGDPPDPPSGHTIEVWLPTSDTTILVHRNGHEFTLVTIDD
jgi:hypothetical protein